MSQFIATSSCQKVETKCLSGSLYPREDKDILVSKLNSRISQLEQQENDYNSMIQEFKQLQNEVNLLNEAKLRLEYEIKQRDESYNKRISDLKGENENIKNALNDKLCVNKKLFDEKNCLENQLKSKNDEINDIKNQINNLNNRFNTSESARNDLQNTLNDLNALKSAQRDKIAELVDDNKKLAQLCQEQDHSLYLANQEKDKLAKKLNDDNNNINNLNSKLRAHANNLNNLQNQLDQSNELNLKFKKDLQNLEDNFKSLDIDNQTMEQELDKERALRQDEDNNNAQLKLILNDRKQKLRNLNNDYYCLKNAYDKKCNERNMYNMEGDKLKEHIIILTKQNDNLSIEVDNVLNEDIQMKNILNNTDRISTMLQSNESILSQMPSELLTASNSFETNHKSVNEGKNIDMNEGKRSFSPKFTYSRMNNNNL